MQSIETDVRTVGCPRSHQRHNAERRLWNPVQHFELDERIAARGSLGPNVITHLYQLDVDRLNFRRCEHAILGVGCSFGTAHGEGWQACRTPPQSVAHRAYNQRWYNDQILVSLAVGAHLDIECGQERGAIGPQLLATPQAGELRDISAQSNEQRLLRHPANAIEHSIVLLCPHVERHVTHPWNHHARVNTQDIV